MNVIPSLLLLPDPGLLALDLIELTSKPVFSLASSIVSKTSLVPFLYVTSTLVFVYFFAII
jgi:hypothetical protein